MAAGPRRPASRRHQHADAGRLRRCDRGRAGVDQIRSTGSVRCSPSMPMPSITAAPRSSRRSPPSRSATTTSVTSSRPPRIGSSRCIGASPMATSIRVPGAEDSTPPCGSGCRLGRRCSIPATSTTDCSCPSCCTVVTIRGVRCSDRPGRGRETREFLRNAHSDIPAVVEAMRQYWMPTRYARAS